MNQEKEQFQKAVRKRTFEYILAAFGLLAGLAWNEAIKGFIEVVFPLKENTIVAKFAYAVLITVVVVIVSIYISKLFKEEKEGDGNNE